MSKVSVKFRSMSLSCAVNKGAKKAARKKNREKQTKIEEKRLRKEGAKHAQSMSKI